MQRSRNLLATKVSETGETLDAHLRSFQHEERTVIGFYDPIVDAFERNAGLGELREVILIQVDKLYSDAGVFFQNKTKKDGLLQRDFHVLAGIGLGKGAKLSEA
jgi:hypothetical protein